MKVLGISHGPRWEPATNSRLASRVAPEIVDQGAIHAA